MHIRDLQKNAHAISRSKGWYQDSNGNEVVRNFGEVLMLMVTELAEAMEEWRNDQPIMYFDGNKPEGVGIELADCIIRIADTAEYRGIDLEECLRVKMEYNKTRPQRHGGKRA